MQQSIRVLYVGTSESNAETLLSVLEKHDFAPKCRVVDHANLLQAAVEDDRWDVVVCECAVPMLTPGAILQILQENGQDLPLIVVASTREEEIVTKAMREGAADYIGDEELQRFGYAVRREVLARQTRKALKQTQNQLDRRNEELALKERGARRAETNLKKEALRRRVLMNASRDGIAIFNQDHRVVESNQRFAEMLGYTQDEVTRLYTWDFEAVMSEPEIRAGFADLTKTYATFETRHRRKDGTLYDAEVSASGALVGDEPMVFTISRDITEKKRLQATLAQSDRLSSMGMLAAGVAHEINNPLAFVLYHLQILSKELPALAEKIRQCREKLETVLTENGMEQLLDTVFTFWSPLKFDKINKRVQEAFDGTRRIQEIAGALSTFSRVERHQLVPVNVHYTIECAANMAFNEIKYRARFIKDFGKISKVMASEGQLSQIFLNLLINAVHALEEGNVEDNEIRVRTWQEGDDVCVEVRDTGKGISPENLDRIFEPFFTTKNVGEGSGLGLTISRNIIAGYGGSIDVESRVGEGTSFFIRIPIKKPKQEKPSSEDAPPVLSSTQGRILVIDDEAGIREALQDMLDPYEVLTASSGESGKALIEKDQAFDLILCDLMMPEMSGMALHQWLKNAHSDLAERLVFVTGGAFTPKARDYLTTVDNLCIHKPFDVDDLTGRVFELIEDNRKRIEKT